MAAPTIPTLPTAPTRGAAADADSFILISDAWMAAIPAFGAAQNLLGTWMNDTASTVQAQAAAAAAGVSVAVWVTGTTYAIGDVRYSPTTFYAYRRKTAGAGATDPASDTTNWALVSGAGDVTQTGTQTLTNKTLTSPTIDGTITEDVYTITDGASVDINPANGSIQLWTLGASRTPTASSFTAGKAVTLLIADGTAFSVTWSTIGVVWAYGTAPTLPTTGYGVIVLIKIGSTVYGFSGGTVA